MKLNLPTRLVRLIVNGSSSSFLNVRTPLSAQRLFLDALGGYNPLPSNINCSTSQLGNRPAQWFTPKQASPDKVILYCHGGAYCIGSPRSHRDLCSHLALYANIPLVIVDYRLAPEHKYPAALEDIIKAYHELLALGYQAHNIAIVGDSAGGGLCLASLQALRDQEIPLPAAAFLISPWLNMQNNADSHRGKAAIDPLLSIEWLNSHGKRYLTPGAALHCQASPLFGDMQGLPPLLIHVGEDEILLDDSIELHQKALIAEVSVELNVEKDLWHVFHFTPSLLQVARQGLQQGGDFLRQHLKVTTE